MPSGCPPEPARPRTREHRLCEPDLQSAAAPADTGLERDARPHLEWVAATGVGRSRQDSGRSPTAREGERADGDTRRRASRTSEPSPAPEPRPASRTGPTGPILRANPYPEVTDLICRLPLPTLVYRPEASYLGDRLRIWVRTGPKLGYIAGVACQHAASQPTARARDPGGGHGRSGSTPPVLHPMQLPASHVSRTGSGTRDAARTAALYGRPCYQHPFALRVASRVTAP